MENTKNTIGLLTAILLLGYGLIRIGVGASLLAQTLEIINFSEFADAILEVKEFISIRASDQIIPFTLTGYFAYILLMGVLLTIGAVGTIVRRRWGFILLWIYIGAHAALFINYLEINPKLIGLVLQVILLFGLKYLRPSKPLS
jgi:hypothetical protein